MKTQMSAAISFTSNLPLSRSLLALARPACLGFKSKRENGEDQDNPKNLSLDYDGKDTWVKGEVKGDMVYGVKRPDGYYDYELQYDAGIKDKEYFEAKDRNYLTRICGKDDDSGELRKLEPAVWYLRKSEGAQNTDIGDWWSQKLKLPNIGTLLENAEKLHAIATSWQDAPMEICELIANEFSFDLSPPKI
jgi:hypothetical protein